jgi:hypothetical protein
MSRIIGEQIDELSQTSTRDGAGVDRDLDESSHLLFIHRFTYSRSAKAYDNAGRYNGWDFGDTGIGRRGWTIKTPSRT